MTSALEVSKYRVVLRGVGVGRVAERVGVGIGVTEAVSLEIIEDLSEGAPDAIVIEKESAAINKVRPISFIFLKIVDGTSFDDTCVAVLEGVVPRNLKQFGQS